MAEEFSILKFRTTLLKGGKTATGIQVPAEIVAQLGAGKRPAVRVTINGYTYRSSIAVMGGVFMVGVSAEVREKSGVAGGDEVDIEIQLDTASRQVDVPADFRQALDGDADAGRYFESLSYSNRRRLVEAIEQAKAAETRARRIEKTVELLREGKS